MTFKNDKDLFEAHRDYITEIMTTVDDPNEQLMLIQKHARKMQDTYDERQRAKKLDECRDLIREHDELVQKVKELEKRIRSAQAVGEEKITKKTIDPIVMWFGNIGLALDEFGNIREVTKTNPECDESSERCEHPKEAAPDDLIDLYQSVLRDLGCKVEVVKERIPEFSGTRFHTVPVVRHIITNDQGYRKEIGYRGR